MPDVQIIAVDPKRAHQIWPAAEPFIERAYKDGDQNVPPNILADLRSARRVLWLAVDENETIIAAMLTELFTLATGKMCKMQQCGGERMQEWKHLRRRIEDYARDEGCDRVMCEGRPGWARMLPDYQQVAVVLEKRL